MKYSKIIKEVTEKANSMTVKQLNEAIGYINQWSFQRYSINNAIEVQIYTNKLIELHTNPK